MNRAPTAAQRTVSLFDGKTDLERKPDEGRDGSLEELRSTSAPRRRRRLIWEGGVSRWWTKGDVFEIELTEEGYEARFRGVGIGTFPTIIEAGRACEAKQ